MSVAELARDYVELSARSSFSFLEGVSNPEDLVDRAAALGHGNLALADRDGLYAAPRFFRAARQAGIRPLVGASLEIGDRRAEAPGSIRLRLLAESRRGYRSLSRLLTRAQHNAPKGDAFATWENLEEHADGLVALAPGNGTLHRAFLDRARSLFPERLWIEISRTRDRSAFGEGLFATALAESLGLPIVATGNVRCAYPEGRRLLDAFTCLREKTSLDRAGRLLARNGECALLPARDMAGRFADRPEWIRASREISERCAYTMADLGYRFPDFPCPSGEDPASWLYKLTFAGAHDRYGSALSPRVRAQLERELALIAKLDLAGYFLIVYDIARFAKEQKILCQGRGSAANSAVCYALGITAVDPVAMELLFERFLSEERGEWPDIDLDLPSGDQRERVIQYVFEKYGERGAAMTATVISYKTRSAVREMGKVLGMEPDAVDRLAKVLSSFSYREDLDELRAVLRQAGVDPDAPRIRLLLDLVDQVRGLPRHLGQHTGGIVISAGRLDDVVPIEPAAMENRAVIQWDKDDCADLGLIKIDLLGLGMLDALERTLPMVREHYGEEVDLAHLPQNDAKTYAMIQRADTIGVFQIESRAQMATLPRMKPACFYDLVVEIAIIRPGPIVGQMVHPYLNRRAGREAVRYPHPSVEPILKRTLGVPIFQEQLLRVAMVAAGLSGGEAEELRRAMGFKRSAERMKRIEASLRAGMNERGIVGEAQEEIVRGISSFALYGFPESHSASFALIAYASAYLRAHYPAAFLAGMLNAYPLGFYNPATLVKDGQLHGVEVRAIDAAHSDWACTLEPGRESPALRLGLRYVHGLRREVSERLVRERRRRAFRDCADLLRRVPMQRAELDTLAELGALAGIEPELRARREALWQVSVLERDPDSLFAGRRPKSTTSPLEEMNPLDETLADYRTSGITVGPHVMQHFRTSLRARGVLAARELRAAPNGRWVTTAGHVIVRQRPGSAKGFCFLTLEDETGTANAVLTPDQFQRFRTPLHTAKLIEIEGPVQNVEGVIHVRIRKLRPLSTERKLPDSHDYR